MLDAGGGVNFVGGAEATVRYTGRGKAVHGRARLRADGTSTVLGFAGEVGR